MPRSGESRTGGCRCYDRLYPLLSSREFLESALGVLRWAGEAVVHVDSLFRRKEWRRAGFFSGGVWEGNNDNRQNLRLEGKLEPGTPGHLGYVNPTFSLPGETLHVTKLKSWFD